MFDDDRTDEWTAALAGEPAPPRAHVKTSGGGGGGVHTALVAAAARTVAVRGAHFRAHVLVDDLVAAESAAADVLRACATIAAHARLASVERTGYATRVWRALVGRGAATPPDEHDTLAYYANVAVDVRDRLAATRPPPLAHPRPRRARSDSPVDALEARLGSAPLAGAASPTHARALRASSGSAVRDAHASRARELAEINAELGAVAELHAGVAAFVDDQGRLVDRLDAATLAADEAHARSGRYLVGYEARTRGASSAYACECVPLSRGAAIRTLTLVLATGSALLALAVW